jgi:ribosome maturation factor RimP
MTHPLIPQILELAGPIAQEMQLEVVNAVFQTNHNPPVLRLDIRNTQGDTGLEDCEHMSRALEAELDIADLIPGEYVLEVSSPGLSDILTTDRDFSSFKGFSITVQTLEAFKGQTQWQGRLVRRDEVAVHLNHRGRSIAIPRELIAEVQLSNEG